MSTRTHRVSVRRHPFPPPPRQGRRGTLYGLIALLICVAAALSPALAPLPGGGAALAAAVLPDGVELLSFENNAAAQSDDPIAVLALSCAGGWADLTATVRENPYSDPEYPSAADWAGTVYGRPKRDLWVAYFQQQESPFMSLTLTPCRTQAELEELVTDVEGETGSAGVYGADGSTPYYSFRLDTGRVLTLFVVNKIAYLYEDYDLFPCRAYERITPRTGSSSPQPGNASRQTAPPAAEALRPLRILRAEAFSTHEAMDSGVAFDGSNLLDGDDATSWQYDRTQTQGILPSVHLILSEPSTIDALTIRNGYWKISKGFDQYKRNGRIRQFTVSFLYRGESDYRDGVSFPLPDEKTEYSIALNGGKNVISVCVAIESVYTGSYFTDDVAVNELGLTGHVTTAAEAADDEGAAEEAFPY